MAEKYYAREDLLPDTPEQALANWNAQSNSLAHIVPEVAQRLNETGHLLALAQQAANARGDLGASEQISVAWSNIEWLALQPVQLDAARQAATEVIKVMDVARKLAVDEKEQAQGELKTLNGEISDLMELGGTEHPLLSELVEALEEHWGSSGFHRECPGCMAMDNGWYDVLDHDAVNSLFYALMSADAQFVPLHMRESLAEFLHSWTDEWDAFRQSQKEQEIAVSDEEDES